MHWKFIMVAVLSIPTIKSAMKFKIYMPLSMTLLWSKKMSLVIEPTSCSIQQINLLYCNIQCQGPRQYNFMCFVTCLLCFYDLGLQEVYWKKVVMKGATVNECFSNAVLINLKHQQWKVCFDWRIWSSKLTVGPLYKRQIQKKDQILFHSSNSIVLNTCSERFSLNRNYSKYFYNRHYLMLVIPQA